MKRMLFLLTAAWFLAAAAVAAAQVTPVDSRITKVTVFSASARVTREATVSVDHGVVRLFMGIDAFSIDSDSATATVYGAGELLGVAVRKIPQATEPQKTIEALEKKLADLRLKKQALTDQKETLTKQADFLDSVIDFSKTQIPREIVTRMPKPDELNKTLSFLGKEFTKINDSRRRIDEKIDNLEKEIRAVIQELNMRQSRSENSRTGIEVLFKSNKKQQIRIDASYIANNAGWRPVYRASVSDPPESVTLSMMAKITQKTGEEWHNVALTVSNAVPLKGGRLPELYPWYISMPHPAPRARMAEHTMQLAKNAAAFKDQSLPEKSGAAPQAAATVRRSTLSFEYVMPVPATIASRQEETLLPLFSRSITGTFYDFCAPRRDPHAYLVCKTKADSQLLPGPVSIFFAGRYVGKMMLDEMQPGEPFVLGLGIDRGVKVKRVKIKDKVKETYFGKIERSDVVREMAFRITAENLKDQPVNLKIVDQVPVSKTDRITVSDIRFNPEPQKRNVDDKPGVMRWELTADPHQPVTFDISFSVSYPKDIPPPIR